MLDIMHPKSTSTVGSGVGSRDCELSLIKLRKVSGRIGALRARSFLE